MGEKRREGVILWVNGGDRKGCYTTASTTGRCVGQGVFRTNSDRGTPPRERGAVQGKGSRFKVGNNDRHKILIGIAAAYQQIFKGQRKGLARLRTTKQRPSRERGGGID